MWPRWEVFKKDNAKKPYQAVGSVHATDPEHALLNAKNVFVRRPAAVSLWVAPVSVIFSRSLEELEREPLNVVEDQPLRTFELFRKATHRRSMTFMDHLGRIEATDPAAALALAIEQFGAGLAWWVIPTDAITGTDPDETTIVEAWFEPAKSKTYKQQSQYGFVSKCGRVGSKSVSQS